MAPGQPATIAVKVAEVEIAEAVARVSVAASRLRRAIQ